MRVAKGGLGLNDESYANIGARIAEMGLPTAIIFEGGYNLLVLKPCWDKFMQGLLGTQQSRING